jgi:hypothetical protein
VTAINLFRGHVDHLNHQSSYTLRRVQGQGPHYSDNHDISKAFNEGAFQGTGGGVVMGLGVASTMCGIDSIHNAFPLFRAIGSHLFRPFAASTPVSTGPVVEPAVIGAAEHLVVGAPVVSFPGFFRVAAGTPVAEVMVGASVPVAGEMMMGPALAAAPEVALAATPLTMALAAPAILPLTGFVAGLGMVGGGFALATHHVFW